MIAHLDKAIEGARPAANVAHLRPADLRAIICLSFRHTARPADVAAFKQALIDDPAVLHSVESSGAFDFMIEIAAPDVPSYREWVAEIGEPLWALVERFEANFVCDRFVRREGGERAIWVPCKDGARRVALDAIDKVVADGDYMRVHSRGRTWLVHATMRAFVDRLAEAGFVQIHRSVLVRTDRVERLIHEGKHWLVQLADGSRERVARSHLADVLRLCHF